jgi:hypothetical protein
VEAIVLQARKTLFTNAKFLLIILLVISSIACSTLPLVNNSFNGQATTKPIVLESPSPIIIVVTATPILSSPTLEPLPTDVPPTATEFQPTPSNTFPPFTPTQTKISFGDLECVLWSEVDLTDVGKRLCVYGNYVDTENWQELIDITKNRYIYKQYTLFLFAHDTTSFRLLMPADFGYWIWGNNGSWKFWVPADCIMAKGIIESYGPRPMMQTSDISPCP